MAISCGEYPTHSTHFVRRMCSHHTALRDNAALVEADILKRNSAGGQSTSYALVL